VAIDVEIQIELEELEDLATSEEEASADGKNASGLLNNFDPFDTLAGQESDSDSEDGDGLPGGGDVANFSDVSSEGEGDEEEGGREGGEGGALGAKEVEKRAKRVREMVAKLDGVMDALLKWLSQTSIDTGSYTGQNNPESPEQHPHFLTLLSIFDRTILTTFKSRYTQFLLFYLVSLPSFPSTETTKLPPAAVSDRAVSSERDNLPPESNLPNPHADYFLGLLLHNTLVPQPVPIPVLTRIASASYLASFVSRALCVGQPDCRQAVILCCQWIDGRLIELEGLLLGSTATADGDSDARAELSVFYGVVQAVFLIFCFRWRDLLEAVGDVEDGDEEEQEDTKKRWLNELSVVQRLIVSPLNPLKVRMTFEQLVIQPKISPLSRSALQTSSFNSLVYPKKSASSTASRSSRVTDAPQTLPLPPRALKTLETQHLPQ
jgi:RNA polymerase I-specific transcription initiation factor RRN3